MTRQQITAIADRSTRRCCIGSYRRYDRYNKSLVNRIEDLMNPYFLMNSKSPLEENNRVKRGHPYKTSDAFITFLAKYRTMFNTAIRLL
jgi:hypothetical protein